MGGQPALTLGVQIDQVRTRDDHPVEQRLELGRVALADVGHLPLVAEARRLLHQEPTQRLRVAPAQNLAELADVVLVAGRHLVLVLWVVSFHMRQRSTR